MKRRFDEKQSLDSDSALNDAESDPLMLDAVEMLKSASPLNTESSASRPMSRSSSCLQMPRMEEVIVDMCPAADTDSSTPLPSVFTTKSRTPNPLSLINWPSSSSDLEDIEMSDLQETAKNETAAAICSTPDPLALTDWPMIAGVDEQQLAPANQTKHRPKAAASRNAPRSGRLAQTAR